MSQRQLWALFIVSSAAAAVAPIVAQWTGARINVEPVADDPGPTDGTAYDDDAYVERWPSDAPPVRSNEQNGQVPDDGAPGLAESDSESRSAPAGG